MAQRGKSNLRNSGQLLRPVIIIGRIYIYIRIWWDFISLVPDWRTDCLNRIKEIDAQSWWGWRNHKCVYGYISFVDVLCSAGPWVLTQRSKFVEYWDDDMMVEICKRIKSQNAQRRWNEFIFGLFGKLLLVRGLKFIFEKSLILVIILILSKIKMMTRPY